MSTDPAVLSDGQLLQFCASLLEVHAESIFVYAKDGRRMIAELRKRAVGTAAPVVEDASSGLQVVADDGEILLKVMGPRERTSEVPDGEWLPNPIPGRTNIRLSVIDDEGGAADMELGSATPALAERVCSLLIHEHSEAIKRKGKKS